MQCNAQLRRSAAEEIPISQKHITNCIRSGVLKPCLSKLIYASCLAIFTPQYSPPATLIIGDSPGNLERVELYFKP